MTSEKGASATRAQALAFGAKLDAILRRKGWTTTRLAEELGVTWAAADRQRKGRAYPREPKTWVRLCEVLAVTPWELMPFALDYEPPFAAWRAFLETDEGKEMSADERVRVAFFPILDGDEPTVTTYTMALMAVRAMKRRAVTALP